MKTEDYVMNENELILYDREGIYTWSNWETEIDWLNCGGEHEWEYRYHYSDSGRLSLFRQCSTCGKKGNTGGSLKHDTVPNLKEKIALGEIKKYDLDLLNKKSPTWDGYHVYKVKKFNANEELEAQKKELEAVNRRKFYKDYIASDKWKAIRLKVLKRDNNLCQACLESPATDVHHITYANLGDELMFELLSVCRDCHFNRLHKDKR